MKTNKTMKKTLGGDRLGSGNKMQVRLHDYERSTHNLSKVIRTSMAAGVLTPVYRNYALNGDTWDINISHLIKTLPTKGPLMGSMKFQVDFFVCPMRLYIGLLHNNAVKIGMQMDKVYLPQIELTDIGNAGRFSGNSLCDYMGIRGLQGISGNTQTKQKFGAIPILAYYDIFKNYYSNKQEEKAYVISTQTISENEIGIIENANIMVSANSTVETFFNGVANNGKGTWNSNEKTLSSWSFNPKNLNVYIIAIHMKHLPDQYQIGDKIAMSVRMFYTQNNIEYEIYKNIEFDIENYTTTLGTTGLQLIARNVTGWLNNGEVNSSITSVSPTRIEIQGDILALYPNGNTTAIKPNIVSFPLENIDKMRYNILKQTNLGAPYVINDATLMPYSTCYASNYAIEGQETLASSNHAQMNGLCLKTYQSDIYNAWLNNDWIDGKGALGDGKSIQSISSVDVSNGQLTMDALNLAQKIYNMLNRVAASGGTYEDWQEAIYGEEAVRRAESPAYIGGASCEIIFDEVVSTAEAGDNPQGNLSGKGATTNTQGGHISVKITEPSIIIGIASITPRIDYSQGNWWAGIELQSMDDLHKPALDGIGFQDLMAYNLSTKVDAQSAIGKTPAWMHWMTDVNECYGDFAEGNVYDWMVLNRKYEDKSGIIKDLTTYIDPSKYNGIFADAEITAQNYWVQLGFDIKCRRKMSAKLIPNL